MGRGTIRVTEPFLPPLDEFVAELAPVWESKVLTNDGSLHKQLERMLCEELETEHISLFNNGTIALITALRALDLRGEVITTPYSFVATTHAIVWAGLEPVFVDIDPETFNIDANRIATAITPRTTAIVPVHCYGFACDVDSIRTIADRFGISVVYDAAHAFGVRHKGSSLLHAGDLSVLSFHATKSFSTIEGGAIVCKSREIKDKVDRMRNFGIADEQNIEYIGLNGKLNEVCAAFGLVQLRYFRHLKGMRQKVDSRYRQSLKDIPGLKCLGGYGDPHTSYSYFPVLVEDEFPISRDDLLIHLRENAVQARRYFFPLISDLPMYRHLSSAGIHNLPVATAVSRQVLCLPMYPTLSPEDQDRIVDVVRRA